MHISSGHLEQSGVALEPELFTRHEIANKLKVSVRAVDMWTKQGRIDRIKIGSSIRYDWVAVVASLRAQSEAMN
jgi:hypothetical protein